MQCDEPNIWDNQEQAQKLFQRKSALENKIKQFDSLANSYADCKEYYQLALAENDQNLLTDTQNQLDEIIKIADIFVVEAMFSGDNDANDCFIDINAGAGGSDSCDFAVMLMRMYERFSSDKGFKVEIISMVDGDEAGIRSATLKITGQYAFGWLKSESGVHRLVRISPFNANGKRQTSFASIWVYPEISDEIDIEIAEKDLRIDTYRASGAGGQHVNKTDSAVRITHMPTNIVVQCQSDRSQLKNKAAAMKMLKSRLYEMELQKKQDELDKVEASKTDNSWGHQIRSYVMHPYQMVKDLRTGYETANIQAVFDGKIADFIKETLTKN